MKRVVIPAAAAILVLACAAVAVWIALVRGVAAALPARAQLAGELLDQHTPVGEAFARTLRLPGMHVVVVDHQTGVVYDAGSAGTVTRPARGGDRQGPPPARPPNGPDSGAPNGGPPNGGPPGPPPAPQEAPPPARRVQGGPIESIAMALAGVPYARIERPPLSIDLSADARELGIWLELDLIFFSAGALLIAIVAVARAAAVTREERITLEARAHARGEEAERYKRFLAETGHELRTPLTVMAGYVDILRARDPATPVDPRILDGMHAEASRMRVLVEKMMTLARLESTVSVPRLLEIGVAAREAAQTIQRRYAHRAIEVRTEHPASIVIDADDYAAALGNILENAVTYAPDSPIAIATFATAGYAVTTVTDRGPGIPAAEREAIFQRFQRGRGRAYGEGLGLGLAIVKRVADRWGGTVDCTSGDGETVFRLRFPLADEEVYGVAR